MTEITHQDGVMIVEPGVTVHQLPVLTFPLSKEEETVEAAVLENRVCLFTNKDGFYSEHVQRLGAVNGEGNPIQSGGNLTPDAS